MINIILIIIGFILLIKGADYLVDGASNIPTKYAGPQTVKGLNIENNILDLLLYMTILL